MTYAEFKLRSLSNETLERLSPPAVTGGLKTKSKTVHVVRDDLLAGGTKQRACAPFLLEMTGRGYGDFIYASPFSGFAQVALAYTCQILGLKCTLYCEKNPVDDQMHAFTRLAQSHGAKIHLTDSLGEAEDLAEAEARKSSQKLKIPLGFNCEEFRLHLRTQLRIQWNHISRALPTPPKNFWITVGSGTLARAFHEILPHEVLIRAIDVHVLNADDARITSLREIPRLKMFSSSLKFHEPARMRPLVPSNVFYDAKVWEFALEAAEDGDVWWNVAR